LTRFIQTVAATLGPEALVKYIDPSEAIKRLAAAQGIDVLNLVRTAEQLEQLKEETVQDKTNASLVDQAGQLAGTPILDPSRNPDLVDQATAVLSNLQPPEE
jgi:23S rRNA U2552 (ribose-2'-O)-methylase RlmE/FtsJ